MDKKQIPGTMGFSIDQNGNVFDSKGNIRKTYRNGDGYVTVSIKWDDRCWRTVSVARLVGLVFLSKTNVEQTEINHIDCNLENNSYLNLEWVTSSQNNIHSEVMRKDNQYPTLYSMINNEAKRLYFNIHEASRDTGFPIIDIWNSIKNQTSINGISFHHRPYNGNIPKNLHKSKGLCKGMKKLTSRSIKMLNIENGDIIEFPSIYAAAAHFKTVKSHIYQAIPKNNNLRLFKKKYQVAYKEDYFQNISSIDLVRALEHGAKPVISYNYKLKKFYIFKSAKEFIKETGLSRKTVTTTLAKNILKQIDSWVVVYKNKENLVRIKDYINSPVFI